MTSRFHLNSKKKTGKTKTYKKPSTWWFASPFTHESSVAVVCCIPPKSKTGTCPSPSSEDLRRDSEPKGTDVQTTSWKSCSELVQGSERHPPNFFLLLFNFWWIQQLEPTPGKKWWVSRVASGEHEGWCFQAADKMVIVSWMSWIWAR